MVETRKSFMSTFLSLISIFVIEIFFSFIFMVIETRIEFFGEIFLRYLMNNFIFEYHLF